MCGRYTLRKGFTEVAAENGSYTIRNTDPARFEPRFNIAPTQHSAILRRPADTTKTLEVAALRWGLIPSWAKTTRSLSPMINARSETVAEKPAFRAAFQRRRCLVPADGFYEWKKKKGANLPFYFKLEDDSLFHMAGIWESWIGELGETIDSFTILTTHANALLARYHDRMPVILEGEKIPLWLDGDLTRLTTAERNDLFSPFDPDRMTSHPANPIVNNNRSEGPECIVEPTTAPTSQLDLGF